MANKTKYISLAEKERIRKGRESRKKKRIAEIKLQIKTEEEPEKRRKLKQKLTKMTQKKSSSVWTISGGAPGLGERKS